MRNKKIRRFFVICFRAMIGTHSPSMSGKKLNYLGFGNILIMKHRGGYNKDIQ